jgi:glutamate-5-semialdehyde dehydrogenase
LSNSFLLQKVQAAKAASLRLAQLKRETKDRALRSAAAGITLHQDLILEANQKDLRAAEKLLGEGKLSKPLLDRLKLDKNKLAEISQMVDSVSSLEDPVGRTLYSVEMDKGLNLYKVTVPFGVVASIFESRPDALPQIASLCVKSGNSVLLKGGSEALESNRAIFKVMETAFLGAGLPEGCIQLMEGRSEVAEILTLDGLIDLIIPRGGYDFVKFIQEHTRIPVLGHSAGICHIYVDASADESKAVQICCDARVQYPAACNSMKILLVDENAPSTLLPRIARMLVESGVVLKSCGKALEILGKNRIPTEQADEEDWSHEYLELTLPVKMVAGVDGAIEHINRYGSRHTDSIIAEDRSPVHRFLSMVDSSTVIHNASTRFSDGYRYGLGAEVGISTNKVHARGPVGLEGLVTTKYVLLGSGQQVSEYVGKNARIFLHKQINGNWERGLEKNE